MEVSSLIFNLFQFEYASGKTHQERVIIDIIISEVYRNTDPAFDTPYQKGSIKTERLVLY